MSHVYNFTLADMVRISGAERRTIQFWTDRGVLKADVTGTGRGTHRRYSRDEAIIACLIRPFTMCHMSVGTLQDMAKAIRDQMKIPGLRELIDLVIAKKTSGFLVLTPIKPRVWGAAPINAGQAIIDEVGARHFSGAALLQIGSTAAMGLLEPETQNALAHVLSLNNELQGMQ